MDINGKPITHPSDLYAECVARGIPCNNHRSDLYIPVTDETTALLKHFGKEEYTETFDNQVEGGRWYDVPFAYTPAWPKEQG